MRKSFYIWAIAFFALVASSVAREQVYQKGENFADTIIKTRQNNLNFFKRDSAGNKGITFGKWYVSQYMSPWRKKAINFANPINHPVSPDYIYGRKNLWMNFDIVDGQPFPLRKANTTKRGSSAFFHVARYFFRQRSRIRLYRRFDLQIYPVSKWEKTGGSPRYKGRQRAARARVQMRTQERGKQAYI